MTGGTFRLSTSMVVNGSKLPAAAVKAVQLSAPRGVSQTLTYGTTSGKADIFVAQLRTLAAGAGETLDLYATSLLDLFGDVVALRKLKSLAVWIDSGGDSGGLSVGNDGVIANPHPLFFLGTSPRQVVKPGGGPMGGSDPDGVTVDATHRNVKLLSLSAVSLVYALYAAGTSV